jgi:hypothetical protein
MFVNTEHVRQWRNDAARPPHRRRTPRSASLPRRPGRVFRPAGRPAEAVEVLDHGLRAADPADWHEPADTAVSRLRGEITYALTAVDKAPAPVSYSAEARYLGYREVDLAKPYAKFFLPDALPMQPHVAPVLIEGMAPAEYGYDIDDAARLMSQPGYRKMETGWTTLDSGTITVACLTDMPGVTAEMWDWWFALHSCESARYKLWHPDAHQYSAVGEPRLQDKTLTNRQRYIGNVSFVDEYVGGQLTPLAIRFFDPSRLGFEEKPGDTVIAARVGASTAPVAFGWIVHQVRATGSGTEMRSRFFLNHVAHLELPPGSVPETPADRKPAGPPDMAALGLALLSHCAVEMNHLASFLPDLHEEFRDTI